MNGLGQGVWRSGEFALEAFIAVTQRVRRRVRSATRRGGSAWIGPSFHTNLYFGVFVFLLLSPGHAIAQGQMTPPQRDSRQQQDQPFVLKQSVEEVLLYCTVVDRSGKPSMQLEQSAFKVREDGKTVAISHFSKDEVPVSLALLLDDSTSMKQKRQVVPSGALQLLQGLMPGDETSITNFADTAYIDQRLTGDLAQLKRVVTEGKPIAGGTALFDTVISGADELAAHAQQHKQVVVVITDGKDNVSGANLVEAVHRVQRSDGPVIYAIGLLYDLPGSQERSSRKELTTLAEQTGGIALFPKSADEVDRVAKEITDDIHHQYTITFHPNRNFAPGSYHSISVDVRSGGQGHLTVRTRKGYRSCSTP